MARCALPTILFCRHAAFYPQSTQAYLAGTVADSITGIAIGSASISCRNWNSATAIPGRTGASGRFTFAALSPGQYEIRVDAPGYQSQELHLLDLPISARLELEFHLRPLNDIWEARQYQSYMLPESHEVLTFYGPDLDTSRVASFETSHGTISNLETSAQSVIDSRDLNELPLTGRDAYALLVLLPGVTADTTTARGLGFSVNGQRASSANYLLDGLENNNLLVTGPLGFVAPDALEEYRISTNNFSAEFGRTSGFLANVISKSGANDWHGVGYLHVKNELLNANGFQENTQGLARAPMKEVQPGFAVSGPLRRNHLFVSAALDLLRFRSRNDPQVFALPTAQFIARSAAGSIVGNLLREFPAAATPTSSGDIGLVSLAAPAELDRATGLPRLDYLSPSGAHRLFARASLDREREPDLLFNPYPQFSSPFHNGSLAIGRMDVANRKQPNRRTPRGAHRRLSTLQDRPYSEVPQFQLGVSYIDPNGNAYGISLPGSVSSFGYRDLSQNWEAVEDWSWTSGRHLWKFGAGLLERTENSAFTEERDGLYQFFTLNDFITGTPAFLYAAYDRASACCQAAPYIAHSAGCGNLMYLPQDAFSRHFRMHSQLRGMRYDHFWRSTECRRGQGLPA